MDNETSIRRSRLLAMVNGAWTTQAVGTAVKLGVPDRLGSDARTAAALAVEIGVDAGALERLLRALATIDVVLETAASTFRLTSTGELLRADHASSVAAWAMLMKTRLWPVWSQLDHCVGTGHSARQATWGADDFGIFDDQPDAARVFHRAMLELTRPAAAALANKIDWSACTRVVDVGGGSGNLMAALLAAHPHLRGVVLDRPHAMTFAEGVLRDARVLDRCECIAGDFFDSVPPGADAYVLKSVLHDWDDDRCARILASCRAAMVSGSRLWVIERVAPDVPAVTPLDQSHAFSDLNMLVSTGGRERRESEFRSLLAGAGFALSRRIALTDTLQGLEAMV